MSKFEQIIEEYYTKIQSLDFSGSIVQMLLSDRFNKFFSRSYLEAITETDETGQQFFKMSRNEYHRFQKFTKGFDFLPKSILITAVSVYDVLLSQIIDEFFQCNPEAIRLIQQTISYEELSNYATIADARKQLVVREVDLLLREGHLEQLKWLEKKIGLTNISENNPWLPKFIEITERRNLFVHTDGVVNRQYLNRCRELGVEIVGIVELQNIECSREYFQSSIDHLVEFGLLLAQTVWRKVLPAERNDANTALHNIVVSLISDEKYKSAIRIMEYFKKLWKSQLGDVDLLILDINLAQAHKWSRGNDSCLAILDQRKWDTYSEKFRIANHVLREEYEKATTILEMVSEEDLSRDAILEWPLFNDARKDALFVQACKKKYGEDMFEGNQAKQGVDLGVHAEVDIDAVPGRTGKST